MAIVILLAPFIDLVLALILPPKLAVGACVLASKLAVQPRMLPRVQAVFVGLCVLFVELIMVIVMLRIQLFVLKFVLVVAILCIVRVVVTVARADRNRELAVR